MSIDYSKIKLVIWDLDNTFWNGIISEGSVFIPENHIKLINDMVDCGIMCSVCSKNDEKTVAEVLKKAGIDNLFVFKSINWTSKGERVKQIITQMQLRQENVLFIDDSVLNLSEAKQICPGIMAEGVEIIEELCKYFSGCNKNDINHKRLEQYCILEKKQQFKAKIGDNEQFLFDCNIKVEIKNDCEKHIERIYELINRTNQLNFTKKRIDIDELKTLLKDESVYSGYVTVNDNFGDYGIVGFFSEKSDMLLHFLFSCRVLNMGIEQFVYNQLGCPDIIVVPDVASQLNKKTPGWINQNNDKGNRLLKEKLNGKILIKGPCDMEQMFSFIEPSPNIITEFTYINEKGVSIEHYNHTSQIINSLKLDEGDKIRMASLPFCDKNMYSTSIFDDDISVVMLSLFNDPHLGLYEEKNTGIVMAFGEYLVDLTDEKNWNGLIDGTLFNARHCFTIPELKRLKTQFTYKGRLSPEAVLENLKYILSKMSPDSILVLCLGSEMNINVDYLNHESYTDRHIYNQKLNRLIKQWASENHRVKMIDVNNYVKSEDDFLNTINHMKKHIYYMMSKDFVALVNEYTNTSLSEHIESPQKIGLLGHIKRRIRYIVTGER